MCWLVNRRRPTRSVMCCCGALPQCSCVDGACMRARLLGSRVRRRGWGAVLGLECECGKNKMSVPELRARPRWADFEGIWVWAEGFHAFRFGGSGIGYEGGGGALLRRARAGSAARVGGRKNARGAPGVVFDFGNWVGYRFGYVTTAHTRGLGNWGEWGPRENLPV